MIESCFTDGLIILWRKKFIKLFEALPKMDLEMQISNLNFEVEGVIFTGKMQKIFLYSIFPNPW